MPFKIALGPNLAYMFLQVKFYWNTVTPIQFAYYLWLLSHYMVELGSCDKDYLACEVKTFTVWYFTEKKLPIFDLQYCKNVPYYWTVLLVIIINGYMILHWAACEF